MGLQEVFLSTRCLLRNIHRGGVIKARMYGKEQMAELSSTPSMV